MSATRRSRGARRAAARLALANPAPAGLEGGQYRPLTDPQIRQIIDAGYEILARTGVEIQPSPCRDLLAAAGCRVDSDQNRVFIPAPLIDQALKSARPEILLAGRDPAHDLHLGGRRVYLGTGGQAVKVKDLSGQVRETVLADNYHIGRLVDALEHIHFYMRPVVSRDIPVEIIDVNQFYACLAATKKHVMANAYLPETVPDLRLMGEMVAGGAAAFDARPPISFTACWTVSPLRFAAETVEILDAILDHDMPVALSTAPQAGATSPASLAGTLAQTTAEQLAGLAYAQLRRPGAKLLMGCVPAQADLRTGAFTGGSAEFALLNAACAQIAQALWLPIYNSSGISDSKTEDAQAGFEKGLTTAAAALAGSNYVHHSAGFLESLLTVGYAQYVIDNDANGAVMRLTRGVEVDETTLALDVIHDVCSGGPNHYLGHSDTLARMETEYLYPDLFDRRTRADWEANGSQSIDVAAAERARLMLSEPPIFALDSSIDNEIRTKFPIKLSKKEMSAYSHG